MVVRFYNFDTSIIKTTIPSNSDDSYDYTDLTETKFVY